MCSPCSAALLVLEEMVTSGAGQFALLYEKASNCSCKSRLIFYGSSVLSIAMETHSCPS